MSAFDHDNILKLLGIVSESKYSCKVLKGEIEIMSAFDHDNILKLLGIVSESKYSPPTMSTRRPCRG